MRGANEVRHVRDVDGRAHVLDADLLEELRWIRQAVEVPRRGAELVEEPGHHVLDRDRPDDLRDRLAEEGRPLLDLHVGDVAGEVEPLQLLLELRLGRAADLAEPARDLLPAAAHVRERAAFQRDHLKAHRRHPGARRRHPHDHVAFVVALHVAAAVELHRERLAGRFAAHRHRERHRLDALLSLRRPLEDGGRLDAVGALLESGAAAHAHEQRERGEDGYEAPEHAA